MNDILTLHFLHSFIILNVLWIIFAYKLRFNYKSILQVFIIINIFAIIKGFINLLLNSNYMYLCARPQIDNILLVGEWPIYILFIELLFFLYG